MSLFLDIITWGTISLHVILSPYTKVEESFNLHATHDVLMYGVGPSSLRSYDHFTFPGAVPRSFVGCVLLGLLTTPLARLGAYWDLLFTKRDIQILARLVLATINALGLILLRRAVSKRFGFSTGAFYALLTCTQFHVPFWIGRPLPNMFALFPVNIAFYYILNRMPNSSRPSQENVLKAITLLTMTSVVLRAEVVALLAPLVLQALFLKWVTFGSIVKTGLISGLSSIGFTVLIDSYFWQTWPLWPEFHGLYFNVYQGKSIEWGASPFHAYITSQLPKLLLSSLPLSIIGGIAEPRVRTMLFPPFVLVALLSILAHKEWRFIIYTVPLLNIAAARGARWLTRQRTRGILGRICAIAVIGLITGNLLVTYLMTGISRANYPGGEALMRLNQIFANVSEVHVHIDNYAAQTGASLFLQEHYLPYPSYLNAPPEMNWIYNKTENLTPSDITKSRHFTHIITESPQEFSTLNWLAVDHIKAFSGVKWRAQLEGEGFVRFPLEFVYSDKLSILERRK